jgi:hypothetical protein
MSIFKGASATSVLATGGTGLVTAAGKAGVLRGYSLKVGTDISKVIFIDGGSGGTIKWSDGNVGVTVAGDAFVRHSFKEDVPFSTDIYAAVTGTGAILYTEFVQIED